MINFFFGLLAGLFLGYMTCAILVIGSKSDLEAEIMKRDEAIKRYQNAIEEMARGQK